MKIFLSFIIGFVAAAFLSGAFCNVLLTMYEHRRNDLDRQDYDPRERALKIRRLIFQYSLGAGLAFAIIFFVFRFLPPPSSN